MKRTTRRHGAWARVTRAWLVAMMIGIFALTLAGPASAASPPNGGGTTQRPPTGTTNLPIGVNPGYEFLNCAVDQCINTVHLETGGRQAGFVIFDSQSTIATVQLSKVAPKKNAAGDYVFNAADVAAFSLSPKDYTHTVNFAGLDPGATYYYLIDAAKSTPTSSDAQKTGNFTMPKRYVTATIDTITVIDDSDTFSAGDLAFNLRVNNDGPAVYPDADMINFNPANGSTTEWSSGDSRNVGMSLKVVSGDQATITLEGWDWDSAQPGWLNGQPINIDQDTVGISGDKASASVTFDFSNDDLGSAMTKSFSVQTTNQSLKFKATGTISVIYAP